MKSLVRRGGETILGKMSGFGRVDELRFGAGDSIVLFCFSLYPVYRRVVVLILVFALQLLEEPQVEQAQQLGQETVARRRQSRSSSQELKEIEEVNTWTATRPLRILSHFWYYVAFRFWMFVLKWWMREGWKGDKESRWSMWKEMRNCIVSNYDYLYIKEGGMRNNKPRRFHVHLNSILGLLSGISDCPSGSSIMIIVIIIN